MPTIALQIILTLHNLSSSSCFYSPFAVSLWHKTINRDSVLFGRQQMGDREICCPSLLGFHKGGWPCARIYKRNKEWSSQKGLRGQGSSYILMIHLWAERACHSVQQHLFLFLLHYCVITKHRKYLKHLIKYGYSIQ